MRLQGFGTGRISRTTYWGSLIVLTGVLLLFGRAFPGASLFGLFAYLWLSSARLHDAGKSGWLNLIWILGTVALSVGAFMTGLVDPNADGPQLPTLALLAGAALIQFGFLIWAGVLKGDAGANRYGPAPARLRAAA